MTKWSRDKILRWILDRDSQGLPVNALVAMRVNGYMYRLATISYGSWTCALSAAGIHGAGGPRRWSGTRIVAGIRRIGRRPDALRYSSIFRRRRNLYEAARKCFGSWRHALMAADINPDSVPGNWRWDREAVVEAILERALKHQPLAKAKVHPSGLRTAAVAIYGSWREAISAAGLKPDLYLGTETQMPPGQGFGQEQTGGSHRSGSRRKWTRDTIAQTLRKRVQDHKPVHPARLKVETRDLHNAIKRRFGSWAFAMTFAGLDPEESRKDRRQRMGASTGEGHSPARQVTKASAMNTLLMLHPQSEPRQPDAHAEP